MDFYLDNNLNKKDFKSQLRVLGEGREVTKELTGYPYLDYSFNRNKLSFSFQSDKESTSIRVESLEFYECVQNEKTIFSFRESPAKAEYEIKFNTEEVRILFFNSFKEYLKLSLLIRKKFDGLPVQHIENGDRDEHTEAQGENY